VGWTSWRETFNRDLIDRVTPLGAGIVAVSDDRFDNAYYADYQEIRDDLYESFLCHHGEDFAVFFLNRPADLSLPENGRIIFGAPESRKYLRGAWGPDQVGFSKATFVAMGPANRAAITFTTPHPIARIVVGLSSAVSNQAVSIQLNGQPGGTLALAMPFSKGHVVIDSLPAPPADGRWTLVLEAGNQNENRASLLLYTLAVDGDG
jgi:hypothetical protein